MKRTPGLLTAGALALLFGVVASWSSLRADLNFQREIEAGEPVESITVRLDVGPGGDDLEEPVALDLGLGFPLWLHPVGRAEAEVAPFGAVPQEGPAGRKVQAGSSATFTFRASGAAGQDRFETSPQLLARLQVSDVARIGFASAGTTNWELAAYEITLNDQPFASNDRVDRKAADAQDAARFRIAELGLEITPLEAEADDLRALVEADLAGAADLARLVEVESELAPRLAERRRLENQLRATYPWFEEEDFLPPWRTGTPVGSVSVTLSTETHAGADTQNYVYFRTGGRKYLLGSPATPLTGEIGSQTFDLDLMAGPMEAADIRGYAVGMLGQPAPYGDAPDRWHPQRLVIEIADRIVYDSDESAIDRNSLASVRLVPPVHANAAGELVRNNPTARETFLWEAGKGTGLDLVEGGALDLPPPDDPDYPLPEPGLEDGGFDPGFAEGDPGFPPGFDPFPGEWDGGWGWGGGWGFPGGGWPGWDPGWGAPPSWIDLVLGILIDVGVLPPGADPPPVGDPFQIESVAITAGWKADDNFDIAWTVSGDEGDIDHYEVSLFEVQPDQLVPFGAVVVTDDVPAGTHSYSTPLPALVPSPGMFLAPMVVAVPSDPADTPHERIGPAKPLFPAGTNPLDQLQLQNVYVWANPPPPGATVESVSFGGEPPGPSRGVWAAGQVESHNAILFDNPIPAWNVGVRPEPGDEIMLFFMDPTFVGKHRLVAHVGFLGGAGGGNDVTVEMTCRLLPVAGPGIFTYPVQTVNVVNPVGGPPEPMEILEQVVDRADGPAAGAYRLYVLLEFSGGAVDSAHPPALFGLRMIPEP